MPLGHRLSWRNKYFVDFEGLSFFGQRPNSFSSFSDFSVNGDFSTLHVHLSVDYEEASGRFPQSSRYSQENGTSPVLRSLRIVMGADSV